MVSLKINYITKYPLVLLAAIDRLLRLKEEVFDMFIIADYLHKSVN